MSKETKIIQSDVESVYGQGKASYSERDAWDETMDEVPEIARRVIKEYEASALNVNEKGEVQIGNYYHDLEEAKKAADALEIAINNRKAAYNEEAACRKRLCEAVAGRKIEGTVGESFPDNG